MLSNIVLFLYKACNGVCDKLLAYCYKRKCGYCGSNVMLKPLTSLFKGIENIYLSSDIRIAPYLKIITGNHNVMHIGKFMFDGDDNKKPEDDKDVIIEGDSWFGINVIILSGVTIGRGSCIAGGAVVTKSMPRFSIIGGCPAKVLKYRFTPEEIIEHERLLYPESERMKISDILLERENNKFNDNCRSYLYDVNNNIGCKVCINPVGGGKSLSFSKKGGEYGAIAA